MAMLNVQEQQHFRQALLTLQEDLRTVEHSGNEAAQPVELDQTTVGRVSRMDALQAQAMAKESHQRRAILLQRIAASLQRLDQGTFGICLRCGEGISAKRLEFDPTTPVCVECAKG